MECPSCGACYTVTHDDDILFRNTCLCERRKHRCFLSKQTPCGVVVQAERDKQSWIYSCEQHARELELNKIIALQEIPKDLESAIKSDIEKQKYKIVCSNCGSKHLYSKRKLLKINIQFYKIVCPEKNCTSDAYRLEP